MYDIPSFGPSTSHQYMSLAPDNSIDVRSFYAQVNYQPFVNFKFVAGIRLEQMPEYFISKLVADSTFTHFPSLNYNYKQDKTEPIPRFAIIWSMNERNILKILYGQAINRPSFFQNSSNNLNLKIPLLQPEWITTYELNYISYLSEKLILNASIFYNELDNLITRSSQYIDSTKNYQTWFGNAGKMTTTGIELTIQANPVKDLHMEISVTYQNTKDLRKGFENIQVAYSPKELGYLKISYCYLPGMTVALTGNYVGAMLPFYDETIPVITKTDTTYGTRIGNKVNGYFLFGANLRYENIFNHGFYVNIKFSNILNSDIRYPTTTNNEWADKGTLGAGRSFLVSLGKKF